MPTIGDKYTNTNFLCLFRINKTTKPISQVHETYLRLYDFYKIFIKNLYIYQYIQLQIAHVYKLVYL